jgi:hypothetical protein
VEHILGISYGFDHGISVLFVYGEDGFDEIWPKVEEYLNNPRWHYGETQMLGSWIGRKFGVLSWEEIQFIVDATVDKIKPARVALHYDSQIMLEPLMITHAHFVKHKIPCQLFKEFDKAMDWLSEAPERITGMYKFEGDVLWITLRDCRTLEEALRPFERAMKNPKFKPGLKVVWDLTLQHTVLTVEENSRGVEWLVNNGLGKTAMLISNRISRKDMEAARDEYCRLGAEAEVFTDVTKLDDWLETA